MSHRAAAITVAAAAILDLAAGLAFSAAEHISDATGLYWAVATATTVGYGDVVPRTAGGHAAAIMAMLTVIPLFAATFSLFTSGLAAGHIRRHLQETEKHIWMHMENRLQHHHADIIRRLEGHNS